VAFVLATHFGSMEALAKATQEELSAVHEIGDIIAASVHDFFHSAAGKHTIAEFKEIGIDPHVKVAAGSDGKSRPLADQSIVVTGSLEHFTRKEIEDRIQQLGGRPSGSVSKKTSFVVAGADAGSKLDKAKSLGVKVISEKEFIELVGK